MCRKLVCLAFFVAVLSLVLTSVGNAADPEDYLVLHLPFDEGSGAVTEDTSAAGLQVTLEGDYQWTTGMFGQAVAFTNGWAEVSGDPLNLPQITVMAWINPTSIVPAVAANHWTNANNIYGKKGNNGDDSIGLGLTGGNGVLFYTDTGSDHMLFVLDAGVQTGQWQHIAATFDGTIMRVFLDGEQIGEMAASGNIIEIFHPVRVGGNPDQTINFDGAIDDVKVFDQALTTDEIQRAMKGGPAGFASNPSPADEATDVPRDADLNWTPGEFANTHDVYFGTAFNDVNDADRTNLLGVLAGQNQGANTYDPAARLDFGQTYYWRIDEVNAPPDSTIFKGDVWSFTVEPFAYPIENITATASSEMRAGEGPENTVNSSGLDDDDLHSLDTADMWLSNFVDPNRAWIQYEFDRVNKLYQMWVWNYNSSVEPLVGFGVKEATIEYSVDGTNWAILGTTHEFAQGPGAAGYAHNTTVDLGGVAAKYVKITANSNWGGILNQFGLSEVRFLYVPIWAREPSPDSGATDADVNAFLSFRAGREAAKHDLYLSTDEQAVIDGTVLVATVTEPSYASSLDLAGTYYWRVDEVNDAETPTTWQGELWSFSTQEFLVVDDFEDYDVGNNEIWWAWIDGLGYASHPTLPAHPGNGTGSAVGDENTPSYTEETIVHGGNQSMPVFYDNSILRYSEVEKTLTYPRDWTENGVSTLTIWFRGDSDNAAETLYVALNGSAVVSHDNPNAAQIETWTEWTIDLQAFADQDVNLANVNTIALGLGNKKNPVAGGSGTMYFDDIRLYRQAP